MRLSERTRETKRERERERERQRVSERRQSWERGWECKEVQKILSIPKPGLLVSEFRQVQNFSSDFLDFLGISESSRFHVRGWSLGRASFVHKYTQTQVWMCVHACTHVCM